ncbi:hypothetical protein WJX73_005983 [Symbiochloris irregularis]|uniref:RecQ-mediated genome instability protein 1 n=1 Tax=Symbiochloris irregularis TaxID=706552 RepID=A0AAW1NXJ1_9CHLO
MAAITARSLADALHLPVKDAWLDALRESGQLPEISAANRTACQRVLLNRFLQSDLRSIGRGKLGHLEERASRRVPGRFVFQVDEMVNTAAPVKQRYQHTSGQRSLKLALTDGTHQWIAHEYKPVPALRADAVAGFKVAIDNPEFRRGVIFLQRDDVKVLGGHVQHLQEARRRVQSKLEEEPRARRPGQGNALEAATAAAWEPQVPAQTTVPSTNASSVRTALPHGGHQHPAAAHQNQPATHCYAPGISFERNSSRLRFVDHGTSLPLDCFGMDVMLMDDGLMVSAVLSHDLIQQHLGLVPAEMVNMLHQGDKEGLMARMSSLTGFLGSFQGVVKISVTGPDDSPVVVEWWPETA